MSLRFISNTLIISNSQKDQSCFSQKVKQQSIIIKQQKLVIFLINLTILVKMKNIFKKCLAQHAQMSLQLMYRYIFSSFHYYMLSYDAFKLQVDSVQTSFPGQLCAIIKVDMITKASPQYTYFFQMDDFLLKKILFHVISNSVKDLWEIKQQF